MFRRLDPEQFQAALLTWITASQEVTDGEVVAIDGKTLRGSYGKASSRGAIHMVSAWATVNHISLGQVVIDAKSNEITADSQAVEADRRRWGVGDDRCDGVLGGDHRGGP